jgi:hypothetical protein
VEGGPDQSCCSWTQGTRAQLPAALAPYGSRFLVRLTNSAPSPAAATDVQVGQIRHGSLWEKQTSQSAAMPRENFPGTGKEGLG